MSERKEGQERQEGQERPEGHEGQESQEGQEEGDSWDCRDRVMSASPSPDHSMAFTVLDSGVSAMCCRLSPLTSRAGHSDEHGHERHRAVRRLPSHGA